MSVKKADPIDKEVGERIRLQRISAGMSQTTLAQALGVTFQQVQKYEKGVNRVGAGRMTAIAKTLNISVSDLFGTAPGHPHGAVPDALRQLGSTRQGMDLARAFVAIESAVLRKSIVDLVLQLAPPKPTALRVA